GTQPGTALRSASEERCALAGDQEARAQVAHPDPDSNATGIVSQRDWGYPGYFRGSREDQTSSRPRAPGRQAVSKTHNCGEASGFPHNPPPGSSTERCVRNGNA